MLDKQAIAVSLTPGVLLLVAAVVSKWLDMTLAETVFQFGALAAVVGGGGVAWNNVYSKRSVQGIEEQTLREGMQAGAVAEAKNRDAIEQQNAADWAEWEQITAPPHPDGF